MTGLDGKEVRVTFRLWPRLFWNLKQLALDKRTTTTELINEAIEDILKKYGFVSREKIREKEKEREKK
jgi:predicted transcriptional regulator